MSSLDEILLRLSDGQFHSGEVLAKELEITRAAIWKQLNKLKTMGLVVDAVRGKGYRLQQPLELLNADLIMGHLLSGTKAFVTELNVHTEIDSTNRFLLQQQEAKHQSGQICLAERQTKGRGRRGRPWVSPFGSNIYLSILWRYEQGPASLAGLSLALGLAVTRVLSNYTRTGVGLKWPNDIICNDKKLGGILIEITGESQGPCTLVAGIGLNISMHDSQSSDIDQPWVNLKDIMEVEKISRNKLAAELVEQMVVILKDYPERRFSFYQKEWQEQDIMYNKPVCATSASGNKSGIAKGVDSDGNLIFQSDDGLQIIHSGEVSLRLQT